MEKFIQRHKDKIAGVISCFDRVILTGTLPELCHASAMANLLRHKRIRHALANIARAKNMSELAKKVGVSREGLYKALSEKGNPSFALILKLSRALGLRMKIA